MRLGLVDKLDHGRRLGRQHGLGFGRIARQRLIYRVVRQHTSVRKLEQGHGGGGQAGKGYGTAEAREDQPLGYEPRQLCTGLQRRQSLRRRGHLHGAVGVGRLALQSPRNPQPEGRESQSIKLSGGFYKKILIGLLTRGSFAPLVDNSFPRPLATQRLIPRCCLSAMPTLELEPTPEPEKRLGLNFSQSR